jgi:hypothetical protein
MSKQPAGRRVLAPRKPNDDCQKLWRSMRVLRRFTTVDLVITSEAGMDLTRLYVKALVRAGYIVERSRRVEGKSRIRVLELVKNTGPQAPRAGKLGLLDLNTGAVMDAAGNVVQYQPRSIYRGVGGCALAREHGVKR